MVEDWKRVLLDSITKPEQILDRFAVNVKSLKAVVAKYPMRVPKYYFDLIEEVDDPVW